MDEFVSVPTAQRKESSSTPENGAHSAFDNPLRNAAFKTGDGDNELPLVLPHPLAVNLIPANVCETSGGRHATPTFGLAGEVTNGVDNPRRAKLIWISG